MRQEKKKNIVNQLDIEKKGFHTILLLTDIICVTDKLIAKNLSAFLMSYMV